MQPIFASPAWTRWLNLIGCAGAGGSASARHASAPAAARRAATDAMGRRGTRPLLALQRQVLGERLPRGDRDALRGRLELRVPDLELVRAGRHVLDRVASLGVDGGGVRVLPDEDVAEHLRVDRAELAVRAGLVEGVRARLVLLERAEVEALVVRRVD